MDDNIVEEIPSPRDRLVLVARFPGVASGILFDYWTDPTLLCRWWPQEAEVDPRAGGVYHLAWPQMNWLLRGALTAYAPGERLGFTWHWDHEPDSPVRQVQVTLTPDATGTELHLVHGPYGNADDEQKVRDEEHLPGWRHFLPRLGRAVASR